jgi:uncharacterized repeat protein (TIGR01451 family)
MKRTVFGVLVMSSLVGVGSVGVYYAQGKLAPQAQGTADDPAAERVREPQPIPVGRQVSHANSAQDPYSDTSAQQVVVAENQYPADDIPQSAPAAAPIPADEIPDADQVVGDRYESYDATPAAAMAPAEEIPAADQVAAAPSAGPFAGGIPRPAAVNSEYAEQPTAAEEVAESANDAIPGAPRRLSTSQAAPPAVNQFADQPAANPLRDETDTQAAQTPSDRYGEASFPAESEVQQPSAAEAAPAAAPLAAASLDNEPQSEGTGRPGDPQLNGAQAPALTIEKSAPPEIQIGKPAKFTIKVKNAGTATAHEVEVHDSVPQGTQLLDSTPPANRGPEDELVWALGSLKPGEEQTVELQLMPTQEGEIGSVATVRFHAQASVRTLATKPMLAIEVLGPSKVNKGETLSLRIKLSNPGSGAANGIMLTESVPQGLTHAAGRELEFELGTLKPGEVRELDLALTAAEAGPVVNLIRAEGEASLLAEAQTAIEIVAPELQVSLTGPKLRYLERNATHNISVTNPGTAAAKNIDLVAVLPRTLKFVEANNGGQFDQATNAVYWNLEELPPQETGTVKLTTLPLEAGDAKLLIKSSSQSGLKDEREEVVTIEGLAAINFQLSDLKDPIEIGGETSYEVRVTNQGTKAASNVRLAAVLPRGMKPLSAEGPVRYQVEGQRILFEPLRQLAPKAETVYTIKVQATEVGDQRVDVQIVTEEMQDPVSKEESTRVYGDE